MKAVGEKEKEAAKKIAKAVVGDEPHARWTKLATRILTEPFEAGYACCVARNRKEGLEYVVGLIRELHRKPVSP